MSVFSGDALETVLNYSFFFFCRYTYNHPKNLELLREFRQVLDNKTAEDEYNPR